MLPDPTVPVVAPLTVEAMALRCGLRGLEDLRVFRAGMGPRGSAASVSRLCDGRRAGIALAGVAGALRDGLVAGDVVVAREIRTEGGAVRCPAAPLVAATARDAGLAVRCGVIWSQPRVAHGARRAELAERGADIVDMESASVAEVVSGVPFTCLRAVVDTPRRPLLGPWTVTGGISALRSLARLGTTLRSWAASLGSHTLLSCREPVDLAALARRVDVVLLTGTADSGGNAHVDGGFPATRTPVHRVDGPESISLAWLAGAGTIGLVAGARERRGVTDELAEALRGLGPLTVSSWRGTEGTTQCTHGEEVRR